ncbi:MAG: YqiA/YcfP family alpha/beta fold hydrolase [Pseudomonadota bacterium]
MAVVFFLHGLESGPDGLKIQAMREVAHQQGWRSEAPDFRGMRDPALRLKHLLPLLPAHEPLAFVGSSLGGFVAAQAAAELAASRPDCQLLGLFLLCPAFDLPGYPLDRPDQPLRGDAVRLIHGRHDSVVPLANSERAARDWQSSLLVTEDEHPLHNSVALITAWLGDWLPRLTPLTCRKQ